MKLKTLEKLVITSSKALFNSVIFYTIGDIKEEIRLVKETGKYYYFNISNECKDIYKFIKNKFE